MHFTGATHREPARKRMQLIPPLHCLFFPVWSLQGLLQPLHCPPPNQVGSHFRNKKPRFIFCFVCNLWRSFRSEIDGKFQVQVARIRPLPRLPVVILDYRHFERSLVFKYSFEARRHVNYNRRFRHLPIFRHVATSSDSLRRIVLYQSFFSVIFQITRICSRLPL